MKNVTFTSRKLQAGWGLIEWMILLAFIGLALWTLADRKAAADTRQGSQRFVEQVTQLREIGLGGRPMKNFDTPAITTAEVFNSRELTPSYKSGTNIVVGSHAVATFTNATVATLSHMQMTLTGATGAECRKLLDNNNQEYATIKIGTTDIKTATSAYDPALASSGCNADSVTLVLTAR